MNRVVVGFGSNINPHENISRAVDRIAMEHRLLRLSKMVVTEPVGYTDQPEFLNGAALYETTFAMDRFKVFLKGVESESGRVRTHNRFGPRTIDLDIVFWNGRVIDEDYYVRDFLRTAADEVLGLP